MYPPSFGSGCLSTDCSSSQLLSFKFSISKVTEKRAGIPSVAFLVANRAFLLPAQGVFTANASTTTLNRPHHGTIGRLSPDGHPSHRLSVDSRLTVGAKTATDSRPTVSRRSVDGRSADRRFQGVLTDRANFQSCVTVDLSTLKIQVTREEAAY